jgi:uncharacterized membrane protein
LTHFPASTRQPAPPENSLSRTSAVLPLRRNVLRARRAPFECAEACPAMDFAAWRGMSIEPLLDQPPVIQIHAFAAMAAFVVALTQFALPKGTNRHRAVGYLWAALMVLVVVPSFWIHSIRMWGPWSWIHLLSTASGPRSLFTARQRVVQFDRNFCQDRYDGSDAYAQPQTLRYSVHCPTASPMPSRLPSLSLNQAPRSPTPLLG